MSEANGSDQNHPNGKTDGPAEAPIMGASGGEVLQQQVEKLKSDYLYLRAEFDNYKKQAIKERSELIKFGPERLVRDLLAVLDNFERALGTQVNAENFNIFKQGIEMTASELRGLLGKHGIQEVKSEGVPFDPNHHEALSSEPTDKVPAGHVVRTFQKAYKLHDKLIRPAQVVVAKKPE